MKRIIQILSLFFFVLMVYACIPVPVPVDSTPGGYQDEYGYGYGYDDYIDVPIVYGEPCYYPPPVVVAYPYDYFTYEIIGGFVDIVFWRGGHRYHHEPWYDHGRRVADNDIRVQHHKHPVRWPEFENHREKLQKNHKIYHPDSYYGVKRPPKKQIQQRPDWEKNPPPNVEKRPQWVPPQPQPTPEPRVFEKKPPQVEKNPQWGQQPPPEGQKPVFEPKPPQVEKHPQWGTQPPPPQQKTVVEQQQQTEKNIDLRKKQLEKQRKAKQKLLQKMKKKQHDEVEQQQEKQYRKEKTLPPPSDVKQRPPKQEGQPIPQQDIR